jgi:hypothetical protein
LIIGIEVSLSERLHLSITPSPAQIVSTLNNVILLRAALLLLRRPGTGSHDAARAMLRHGRDLTAAAPGALHVLADNGNGCVNR